MSENSKSGLTRSQEVSVWTGVSGVAIGSSAWMLAIAALGKDWLSVGLTVAFVGIMVVLFARLCLRKGARRLLLLATLLVVLTGHCLAMYWWRFDIWRASANISPEALHREKMIVTYTIVGMVSMLLLQIVIFYWLKGRSRRRKPGRPVAQSVK